ncbi:hypothetical protein [Psychrobacter sp.]|uniref:hypothetical protein n=1 Tax=Psychrobacter sp. TaxID=56811 RepID=UPI00264777FA|nr:hypothetical protein [Psychrobacter sp.]MDN6275839.1 hypothetical protein [Psychrobacter sp.]MDN6308901.1 hypothetical protein [Psychrobacter sp.]
MTISMTASMGKKALWLAPLSAAMLMLAGCSNGSAPADDAETDAAAETSETIKIATESSFNILPQKSPTSKVVG